MRGLAIIAGALALAGCGSKAPPEPAAPIDSVQLNAIASSAPTVAETLAEGDDRPIHPAAAPVVFDFAGDWATNPMLCKRNFWHFTAHKVRVGDESQCTIAKAEARTDSEVKLSLSCRPAAGGIETEERWSLVRRENGQMIVARSAGNGVPVSTTLARCAG